jgi:hypothetical protein
MTRPGDPMRTSALSNPPLEGGTIPLRMMRIGVLGRGMTTGANWGRVSDDLIRLSEGEVRRNQCAL